MPRPFGKSLSDARTASRRRRQAAKPCCAGESEDFATTGRALLKSSIRKAQMLSKYGDIACSVGSVYTL
ncbi:hypothetical protein CUJ84_pRLN5000188 (plasmid) [Rhizobium leguminosarum]|uniref:Uncharacterized protein n=1 Tax=Rhizobium leguminosarum TaxID=384 RepID=A0A2K9ZJ47_RHILE|nr:hypothetical protein CUJ84_pRLN5000188 [Rhizobium leguminosarum]